MLTVARRLLLLPVVALSLVFTTFSVPAHAAVPDVWAKWNLGDKWIRSLDYVGSDLIAGSETSGVFRASSAAGPWADVSSNLTTLGKQVHQAVGQSGSVYLATTAGLFKGNGTGGGWTQIGDADSTPSYQRLNQGGVQSVVFPTGSASYLVVGTSGSGRDGIFYSTDSGTHWTKATGFAGGAYYLTGTAAAMYAATSTGFWKSTDSGKSWTLKSDGIPGGETAKRIAVNPVNSNYLIAATTGGVFRSDNAGTSWYDANGSGSGLLNVSEVRAFQLVPSVYWNGAVPRIVVGSSNGVWGTDDGGLHWAKLSNTKVGAPGGEVGMQSESVYALNIGFGSPGSLIAGTQGHGIFTLPLQAAEAPGSIPAPTGNTSVNSVLTAQNGTWGGTLPFFYLYQWKRCNQSSGVDSTGATCSNINGATDSTYQLSGADQGLHVRVGIRARSLVQQSYAFEKLSSSVGPISGGPVFPPTPPSGWPKLLNNFGNASAPWGTTFTIQPSNPSAPANGNWNVNGTYSATTYTYFWYRCDVGPANCQQFDHSDISYTTTTADVNQVIQARVIGKIGVASSDDKLAGTSGAVYEQVPQPVSAPRVIGQAFVGRVLQSTAGSWTGNKPTFTRRWLRCNNEGVQCGPLNPSVTTPTYVVQAGDKGFTFKIEVKATVVDDFQARSKTVESAQSAVVTDGPPPCSVVAPALAKAKQAAADAAKKVKTAKKKLKKAKKTHKPAKIKKAKKKLKAAKKKLKQAKADLAAIQSLSAAGGC